jgi:hypothetical protein
LPAYGFKNYFFAFTFIFVVGEQSFFIFMSLQHLAQAFLSVAQALPHFFAQAFMSAVTQQAFIVGMSHFLPTILSVAANETPKTNTIANNKLNFFMLPP